MKVIDPGHRYELTGLDGAEPQILTFVKREGEGYPGNVGHYPGIIIQEVLRALIDRAEYVNKQIPCEETEQAIDNLRDAFCLLEMRAARRHGRSFPKMWELERPEQFPIHAGCGHAGCHGECGRGA